MAYKVDVRDIPAQPIAMVRGCTTAATLPRRIRELFDQFYAGFKGKGGLNIVFYPGPCVAGEFEIECGVQLESGGNSSTPAGTVATTTYLGPYDRMKPAHDAIHQWAHENGHRLTGASWEVYGHWSDNPAQLRTDIFYLLAQ
jgi:effector-binding domain-containing protein